MNPLNVYLAASYCRKEQLRDFARNLPFGCRLCASWVVAQEADEECTVEQLAAWASIDYREVCTSDVLIYWSDDGPVRGGKCVEMGIALANGVQVIVVGRREHIFTNHRAVFVAENEEQAIYALHDLAQSMRGLYAVAGL